jgi:hypothetical protein
MNTPPSSTLTGPATATQRGTGRKVRMMSSVVLLIVATLLISVLCLKVRLMPFAWFCLAWASGFFGLIFKVRGSWPRAFLFNAVVAAVTLAVGEAYFSLEEKEQPKYTREYIEPDALLGWAPQKGIRTRASLFDRGTRVYDVTYTIDSKGLRIPPPAGKTHPAGTALFFGCSFTFGAGLEDGETLPYQVGIQSEGRWRALNLAFNGYGPHHMLAAIEGGRVRRVIESPPRYAFFVAIPNHLERVGGRSAVFGVGGPRYCIDPDGKPRLHGRFGDDRTELGFFEASLRRALPSAIPWLRFQSKKSAIYRSFITRPPPVLEEDVRLLHAIVGRARDLLVAEYPRLEFHVILWLSHFIEYRNFYRELYDGFRQLNMPVHRVEELLPGYDVEVPTKDQTRYLLAPGDGHPNALANRVLAEYVVTKVLAAPSDTVDPQSGRRQAGPTHQRQGPHRELETEGRGHPPLKR